MHWIDNFMNKFGFSTAASKKESTEIDAFLEEAVYRCKDNIRFNSTLPGQYRIIRQNETWCYFTKEYAPGCKIIAYIDGDIGKVETTYYNLVDHSGGNHLQLSIGVRWESDGSKEMYSHNTLSAATCIIEIPDDYKAHLDNMKQRRERLARQYNVPFKSLRDE